MTKREAYDRMIEGYAISHNLFGKDEFLFMDDNYIIRDENGNEFEASWDAKEGDSWETDWFIYKNNKLFKLARKKASAEALEGNTPYITDNMEDGEKYRQEMYDKHADQLLLSAFGDDDNVVVDTDELSSVKTVDVVNNDIQKKSINIRDIIIFIIGIVCAFIAFVLYNIFV